MVPPYDAGVERLYDRLVDALERARPRPYEAPVTVAEIYQELVPYRSVRGEVGFAMNADYEHALLSLLASDLAQLEPEHARDEIRRELDSSNPNVSIYRSYAGCDVWIRRPAQRGPVRDPGSPAGGTSAAAARRTPVEPEARPVERPAAGSSRAGGQGDDPTRREASPPRPARPESGATDAPDVQAKAGKAAPAPVEPPETEQRVAAAARTECARCAGLLPQHVRALFCPACGAQQVSTPCAACGETVDPGWSFCVACGTQARPAARSPA